MGLYIPVHSPSATLQTLGAERSPLLRYIEGLACGFQNGCHYSSELLWAKTSARLRYPMRRAPLGRRTFSHAHKTSPLIKDDSEDVDIAARFESQTLTRIGRHAPSTHHKHKKLGWIRLIQMLTLSDQCDISSMVLSMFWELSSTFALVQAVLRT